MPPPQMKSWVRHWDLPTCQVCTGVYNTGVSCVCVESCGRDEGDRTEGGDAGDAEGQGDSGDCRRRSERSERSSACSGQRISAVDNSLISVIGVTSTNQYC